jgi:hypothetical protein
MIRKSRIRKLEWARTKPTDEYVANLNALLRATGSSSSSSSTALNESPAMDPDLTSGSFLSLSLSTFSSMLLVVGGVGLLMARVVSQSKLSGH